MRFAEGKPIHLIDLERLIDDMAREGFTAAIIRLWAFREYAPQSWPPRVTASPLLASAICLAIPCRERVAVGIVYSVALVIHAGASYGLTIIGD